MVGLDGTVTATYATFACQSPVPGIASGGMVAHLADVGPRAIRVLAAAASVVNLSHGFKEIDVLNSRTASNAKELMEAGVAQNACAVRLEELLLWGKARKELTWAIAYEQEEQEQLHDDVQFK